MIIELEKRIAPIISNYIVNWKAWVFVDDTIGYVKANKVEYLLKKGIRILILRMSWTRKKVLFLDVLLIRNGNIMETTVYRKPTNSEFYLNWKSFAPETWKQGTKRF